MSYRCQITGKRNNVANNVSNAKNRTKRLQKINLRSKNIFVPELGKTVRIRLTTSAMRTLNKKSLSALLKDHGMTLKDIL